MIQNFTTWHSERDNWRLTFLDMFIEQLDRTLLLIAEYQHTPHYLEQHYDSIITLIRRGFKLATPQTAPKLIELILAFAPWSLRWQKHIIWLEILTQAVKLAKEHAIFPALCQFQRSRATILMVSGNFKAAKENIDQAIFTAEKHTLSKELLDARLLEFDICGFLGTKKKPEDRCAFLEQLLKEQKRHLDPADHASIQGQILLRRGSSLLHQGRHQEALAFLENGFKLITENAPDNPELLALAYKYRGSLNETLENYTEAIYDNQKLNEYHETLGDRFSEIDSLGDLGLIYWRTGRFIEAERTLQRSIEMAEEAKAHWWLARQLGNQGLVQFTRGNLTKAAELIERQKEISQTTGNLPEEKRAISNGAFVKIFQGKTREATNDLLANLAHIKEKKYHIAEGLVYTNLTWALEDREQALSYAQEALDISEKIASPRLRIIALRALSELQEDPEQKESLAHQTLNLAKKHGRHLNQAGAILTISSCRKGKERSALQKEANGILHFLGAENWLHTTTKFPTKRLPLLL